MICFSSLVVKEQAPRPRSTLPLQADAEQEKGKSEEGLKPSDRELLQDPMQPNGAHAESGPRMSLQELVAAAKLSSAKEEAKRNASHAPSEEAQMSK